MVTLMEMERRVNILDIKINELNDILSYNPNGEIADKLVSLIDERQNLLLDIESVHSIELMSVGDRQINYNKAKIILDAVMEKISTLTALINNRNCSLNKIELQEQRDSYFDEQISFEKELERYNLNVTVGE